MGRKPTSSPAVLSQAPAHGDEGGGLAVSTRKQMGGLSFTPAMPMVAPTPSAGNTGSSAGVLTAGTTSDTRAWELHGEYSTANDRPTVTINPGDDGLG